MTIYKFDEIADTASGGTPNRSNKHFYSGNIPWVKSGELDDNYIFDTEEKITQEAINNSSAKIFPKGTLLMAMYGATAGKTAILQIDAATNQAICSIFPKVGKAYTEFLKYYLIFIRPTILSRRFGGAQPNISQTIIKNLDVNLPSLQEQKTIANILSQIQSAIEAQEKIIQTTTELKKTLMNELFTKGLRGEKQKETEIGLIPESWSVVSIDEMLKDIETRNPSKNPTKMIKYVDVSSVSNQSFSIVGHQFVSGAEAPGRARKVISENDVIFATIRPSLKRIAKVTSQYNDEYCSTAFCVLRCDSNKLSYEYLYQYLLTENFIQRITKLQSGASYPAVTDKNVKEIEIPIPAIDEQLEIATVLSQIDLKIEVVQKKMLSEKDLFQTMLHELMTGQVDIKNIDFGQDEARI